ncbi:mediator of RNA polymerase II transcription subunit 15-like [Neocloeon triangulifer]|uniref:mediator of RNA polymerase II transcription subunit 15-like n=1 Tax=Neocloeon triangulifer TaxID=2078957 RepID=UPI00286EB4FF|nr:mediator of RNA polymerase II transcription subunit 15-like [Neocloeon triangulifer]
MVLKIASLVLLCGCIAAAKEADTQHKRQTYYQGTPQASRYLSGDAYQQHQQRLSASLTQEQDEAVQAQLEAELRRDALTNAKSAAESFKESYRQSRVQQQQPQFYQQQQQRAAYAPTPASPQHVQQQHPLVYEQQEQQPAQQQRVAYAPTPAAPQQQDYQSIRALYQNPQAVQRIQAPTSQASLQAYQAHAQLAEEAAKAFQEALQQQSGRQQKRPRIQSPQYILEQQHSFVVPQSPPQQTAEQYNLAAVQQAYQQIEQQQRKATDEIHAQEARPTVQAAPQEYTEEPTFGYNVGDGPADYEPARQRGQTKYQQKNQQDAVEIKQSRRPSPVRNRPVVSQTYQAEAPRAPAYQTEYVQPTKAAPAPVPAYQPVQYEAPKTEEQVPYEIVQNFQPQTTQESIIPTYQPVQEIHRAPVRQPAQIPTAVPIPAQPTFLPTPTPPVVRIAPPARVAPTRISAPTPAPIQSQAPARAAPAAPVRIPAAPVQLQSTPVQIPATPVQYAAPARVAAPARIAAPSPSEDVDGKLVNLDLDLLRSLYQAAETLAQKQKDEVGPISENDLIKALLEQGKREQQVAEQLKKAAKAEPEQPKVEVVRIPKAQDQRPITQEELQALIAAGYDITPLEEEPTPKNADPIKQQYLRQAEFLERQAIYRSQKQNSRRARDDKAVQDEVATD